ncbi:MAG TPA: hypothetical protein VFN22_09010 [Gemmatimonadales bacterium]|nr:hypothetical protein [Gemmatimonadales bacterium]
MPTLHETLTQTRASALAVHAALLETTRRGWERRHGRVPDGASLLRLITDDPEFSWLAPLTSLIASLDEAMHDDAPESLQRAQRVARAIVDLLRADESGSPFQARYYRELNASPELAVVAAQARPGLQASPVTWN